VGRELQSTLGQRPQQCFMTPLLVGTDGSQKMSKSLNNYIGVAEPSYTIYGKVMSIPDSLILDYFELVTDVSDEELVLFRMQISDKNFNPMKLKKRLADEIVKQLYSEEEADVATKHFERVVQKKEVPEDIKEYHVNLRASVGLRDVLVKTHLVKSRSEASRLIKQGAVSVDGKKISSDETSFQRRGAAKAGRRVKDTSRYQFKDGKKVLHVGITKDIRRREQEHRQAFPSGHIVEVDRPGSIIKVGKRRFVKLIDSDSLREEGK